MSIHSLIACACKDTEADQCEFNCQICVASGHVGTSPIIPAVSCSRQPVVVMIMTLHVMHYFLSLCYSSVRLVGVAFTLHSTQLVRVPNDRD